MPTSPGAHERFAAEVRRIYEEAEAIILEHVARRLAEGIEDEGWAERKLAEIQALRRRIERELARVRQVDPEVAQAIEESYRAGSDEALADLRELVEEERLVRGFLATHEQAVQRFVEAAIQLLRGAEFAILRQAEDVYRAVIAETAVQVLTGAQTRRDAAQAALNRFADRGIAVFRDRAGRNWDIASYAEMAVRSATGQAAVQGHIDRLVANDHDLVIVSDSPEECDLCRPWEGRILSLTGRTPGYPTVAEARAAGLFHPSCTHTLGAWIPGLSRPIRGTANPVGYEQRQRQRYMERQVRKWKRREAAALSDEERQRARAKVRYWQAELRRFVAEHDRQRLYYRESITRAR